MVNDESLGVPEIGELAEPTDRWRCLEIPFGLPQHATYVQRHRSRMDTCYISVNRESGLSAVAGLMSKCGVPKKVTLIVGEKAA
jgi:hypothetical protein